MIAYIHYSIADACYLEQLVTFVWEEKHDLQFKYLQKNVDLFHSL